MPKSEKSKLGQFFTKNAEYILQDLHKFVPDSNKITIVDPFCGEWDLLNMSCFKNYTKQGYDISILFNDNTIKQDTLLNPPEYSSNTYIVTNPPYLAKNKNQDKTIYEKYNTNDLYTCFLKTLCNVCGGIIILPVGFFTSELSLKDRKEFLQKFSISKIYIFEETVFDDTDYTVCSFAFEKGFGLEKEIEVEFMPNKLSTKVVFSKDNGYTFGGEIFQKPNTKIKVSRLLVNQQPNTNIKFYAIDTGSLSGRIRMEIASPFFGTSSDRTFATLVLNIVLNNSEQQLFVDTFNKELEYLRLKYNSLFLSNYRNSTKQGARKRMGFTQMYILAEKILFQLFPEKEVLK